MNSMKEFTINIPNLLKSMMKWHRPLCYAINLAKQKPNSKNEILKFSIAAGKDFGNPERIGLMEPNAAEQICIALNITYMTVYKLAELNDKHRQSACRGHAITYLHDGPTQFASNQNDPRVNGISNYISVCFVGSEFVWQTFRPNFRSTGPDFLVRPHVVYGWYYTLLLVLMDCS